MTPSSAPGRDPDAPEPKAPGRDPDVPADLQAKASGRDPDVPADLQANAPRRGRPGYDLASVLAVAVEIFNERGYDGTSMRDLADRLGIAKSAIYHHVAGKEELLRLALDRALAGLSAVTDRARVLPAPAIERLEYLVRGSVEVLEAELPYVTLLLRVRGNTEVERAALEKRRAFDRFVAELVAQAVIDGDIRPVDPMITARLLFGLVNSVVEWYRPALRTDTRSLADAICAMTLDGLRTRRNR
jgi:AcrR family transcriptional regulator